MARFKGIPNRRKGESDLAYYKRLTKSANQRMLELERLAKTKGYKNILKWAYREAKNDITRIFGKSATPWRFGTKIKKNEDGTINKKDFNAKLNAVRRFLQSPTSTKSGIKEVYQKRAETINVKYGSSYTWEEIGRFWQSETARKLQEEYDSDTVMTVIASLEDLDADTIDAILTDTKGDLQFSDDEVMNDTVKQIMKEYDLSEVDFIFSGNQKKLDNILKNIRRK